MHVPRAPDRIPRPRNFSGAAETLGTAWGPREVDRVFHARSAEVGLSSTGGGWVVLQPTIGPAVETIPTTSPKSKSVSASSGNALFITNCLSFDAMCPNRQN